MKVKLHIPFLILFKSNVNFRTVKKDLKKKNIRGTNLSPSIYSEDARVRTEAVFSYKEIL